MEAKQGILARTNSAILTGPYWTLLEIVRSQVLQKQLTNSMKFILLSIGLISLKNFSVKFCDLFLGIE